jgi:hypothetical protein
MEIPFRTLTIKKTAETVIIELIVNSRISIFDDIGIKNIVEQLYSNTYNSFIIRLKSYELGNIFEIQKSSSQLLSETLIELNDLMKANYNFQSFIENHNLKFKPA